VVLRGSWAALGLRCGCRLSTWPTPRTGGSLVIDYFSAERQKGSAIPVPC